MPIPGGGVTLKGVSLKGLDMDIETLLQNMTLPEKVGQMFLLAFAAGRSDEARILFEEHFVGALYLGDDNLPDARTAAAVTNALQAYAVSTRMQIPLLLGVDQEGTWSVMTRDSAMGPGNLALGAAGDPALTRRMYRVIGEELGAVGVNAVFAPCADCNTNPANAIIGMRSFGQHPDKVAALTAAAVEGALSAGCITTVKHFPGHGDTAIDSHRGLPTVTRSRAELDRIDLAPFRAGIAAGTPMVMTSHIIFTALDPENPATLSKIILGDVLRGELGFDGVIISDSMNMGAIKRMYTPADAAIRAFNAGVDLLMLAEEHYDHNAEEYLASQRGLIADVIAAVEDGRLPLARVDDAVRRVLTLKARWLAGRTHVAQSIMAEAVVGSPEHRAIELDVARAAVAVLRDRDGLIPLGDAPLALVNTTHRAAYNVLGKTRGIGPNQTTPAFDLFAQALSETRPDVPIFTAETILNDDFPDFSGRTVIAVTENHTLPGMDFDQTTQRPVIERLIASGAQVVVVGLRDPYDLASMPEVGTYVCAFSFRPPAARAAAEVVLGQIAVRGSSPVEF